MPPKLTDGARLDVLVSPMRTDDRLGRSAQHDGATTGWAEHVTADAEGAPCVLPRASHAPATGLRRLHRTG
ncbi:hypothetical protein BIV23_08015 [Streptomyces monashensis]|uniref:Uncharacterized protein n=1 Tax=Streptomyces monashensis TaxID=1678012 RepID=A0A1S2QJJ0_9ACTN|nr:hypothetical protein BIV23_08015 [Streptomyces monashensis]